MIPIFLSAPLQFGARLLVCFRLQISMVSQKLVYAFPLGNWELPCGCSQLPAGSGGAFFEGQFSGKWHSAFSKFMREAVGKKL